MVRLSTPIGIFKEKQFQFLAGVKKVIFSIEMDEKWSVDVFLNILAKCLILDIPSTFRKFSCAPLNLSHQEPSFKYPYDYIWSDIFYQKSSQNSKVLSSAS